MTIITREQWLDMGVAMLRAEWAPLGVAVPPVKVSCSWPGGGSARKRIGECWARRMSRGGVNEVFISPRLAEAPEVLSVLAHELVHAVDDCASGHGAEFTAIARRVGLVGKPTQIGMTPDAKLAAAVEMRGLWGDYPHATLDLSSRKRQTTRMLKCQCLDPDCGAVWRMSRATIDAATAYSLYCPACGGTDTRHQ